MLSSQWRPAVYALVGVAALWILALVGYSVAKQTRVTAEKVGAYIECTPLNSLAGDARSKAIRKLEEMLNHLSVEERRKVRLEHLLSAWFEAMTEQEKGEFIEATMPTGFKQMLTSFEQLPEEKRRKVIQDTLRRLKEEQTQLQAANGDTTTGTNGPPVLSPELQAQIRTIGLKTFYSQSSAQTKAELAPVLEELQHVMESGRPFRGP